MIIVICTLIQCLLYGAMCFAGIYLYSCTDREREKETDRQTIYCPSKILQRNLSYDAQYQIEERENSELELENCILQGL